MHASAFLRASIVLCPLVSCLVSLEVSEEKWTIPMKLIEINEEQVPDFLERSDTVLIYFHHRVETKTKNERFLWHLKKAASYLHPQSYGVIIVKVNCPKTLRGEFCSNPETVHNVYIFRNGRKVVLSLESLPDDNAVAASLMHIDLIERVPILKTLAERKDLEKKCLGKRDILLVYLPFLGSFEHRIFMEITYSFLDQYLCALTTALPVTDDLLKPPYAEEDISDAAKESLLWVLSCRNELVNCQRFLHRGVVHLDSVGRFLSALKLPKWSESELENAEILNVYQEPEIDIPIVYFVYTRQDKEDAIRGAEYFEKVFRGSVGIALLQRDRVTENLKRELPPLGGAVLIFQEESQGRRWTFTSVDGACDFVRDYLEESRKKMLVTLREFKYEDFEEVIPQLIQDDPLPLTVREIGKPDMNQVFSLSEKDFPGYQKKKYNLFVLYYLSWEPTSQLAIHFINAISQRLRLGHNDNKITLITKMDCYDWPYFCREKRILKFPTFVLHRNSTVIVYEGIFEKSSLQAFINKYRSDTQEKLCDNPIMEDKGEKFLELTPDNLHIILNREKPLAILIGNKIRDAECFNTLERLAKSKHDLSVNFCWLDSELRTGLKVAQSYNLTDGPSLILITVEHREVYVYGDNWDANEIKLWLKNIKNNSIHPSKFKNRKKWLPLQGDFNFLEKIGEEDGEDKISMDAEISFDIFHEESVPDISKRVKSGKRPVSTVTGRPAKHKEL